MIKPCSASLRLLKQCRKSVPSHWAPRKIRLYDIGYSRWRSLYQYFLRKRHRPRPLPNHDSERISDAPDQTGSYPPVSSGFRMRACACRQNPKNLLHQDFLFSLYFSRAKATASLSRCDIFAPGRICLDQSLRCWFRIASILYCCIGTKLSPLRA